MSATSDQTDSSSSSRERDRRDRDALLNFGPDAILIVDQRGMIVAASPAAEALLGVSTDRDATLADVLPGLSPTRLEALCCSDAGGRILPLDANTATGEVVLVRTSVSPLMLDGHRRFVVVLRDARGVDAALEGVLRAERLAAIDEALSALAHENRNVLQHMQSCVTLIGLRGNDDVKGLVEELQHGQDRLQRLFEELRQFVAPVHLERRSADIRKIIERAWRQLRLRWSSKAIALELDDAACREARANVDPRVLGQALRNVLDTAIACSTEHGAVRCTLANARGDELEIAIEAAGNDGADALEPEALESVRMVFAKGSSQGLAIAQRLLREHGASLRVERAATDGSRFIIALPTGDSGASP